MDTLLCSQNFKLFGFPIFRFWAYLMMVISKTNRAHYIWYLRLCTLILFLLRLSVLLVLNFEEVKSFVYYTVKKQEVVVESLFIMDLRFWIRYEWIVTYVKVRLWAHYQYVSCHMGIFTCVDVRLWTPYQYLSCYKRSLTLCEYDVWLWTSSLLELFFNVEVRLSKSYLDYS